MTKPQTRLLRLVVKKGSLGVKTAEEKAAKALIKAGLCYRSSGPAFQLHPTDEGRRVAAG